MLSYRCYIALGSNLGDRKAYLDRAIEALRSTPGITVRAVSSYHETAPVGGPCGQDAYLNAAAELDSSLEPLDLLRVLQAIERQAGRERDMRWGPRTLDLDILLYGNQVIESEELVVPHPRMFARRFVLDPLCEIAPNVIEPRTGRPIHEMASSGQEIAEPARDSGE